MDKDRRKQLTEEYKYRKQEMGIISFRSAKTDDTFLESSTNTKADINSNRFKLNAGGHPNKKLQGLWDQYGENNFELTVLKTLKFEDPKTDHSEELEGLLIECLESDCDSIRIK